jgi:hypothetical protein
LQAKTVSTEPEVATPIGARTVSTELALLAKNRPSSDPDAEWAELCETPGPVDVAVGQELSLRPTGPGSFGDPELERLAVDFADTHLAELDLDGTSVTDAGRAALQEKLSGCNIHWLLE